MIPPFFPLHIPVCEFLFLWRQRSLTILSSVCLGVWVCDDFLFRFLQFSFVLVEAPGIDARPSALLLACHLLLFLYGHDESDYSMHSKE